jgi:hypothetical protein
MTRIQTNLSHWLVLQRKWASFCGIYFLPRQSPYARRKPNWVVPEVLRLKLFALMPRIYANFLKKEIEKCQPW